MSDIAPCGMFKAAITRSFLAMFARRSRSNAVRPSSGENGAGGDVSPSPGASEGSTGVGATRSP